MAFEIKNDRLYKDGKPVEFRDTPNNGGGIVPRYIVLHDTCGWGHGRGAAAWFCNPRSRVSAHLLIAEDGSVTQFVPFDRAAWHAGKSEWRGIKGLNSESIGIEIANPGALHKRGDAWVSTSGIPVPADAGCRQVDSPAHGKGYWWKPYSLAQIRTLDLVIALLTKTYTSIVEVVGHHHISPGRKIDPTPLMPWEVMRAAVARGRTVQKEPGFLPVEVMDQGEGDVATAEQAAREQVAAYQRALAEKGYAPGVPDGLYGPNTQGAICKFQTVNGLPLTGRLDDQTRQALDGRTAKPFPSASREDATIDDLADRSRTAWTGRLQTRLSDYLGLGTVVTALSTMLTDVGKQIASVGIENVLLLACVGGAIWWAVQSGLARRVTALRLADHKGMRHNG